MGNNKQPPFPPVLIQLQGIQYLLILSRLGIVGDCHILARPINVAGLFNQMHINDIFSSGLFGHKIIFSQPREWLCGEQEG